MDNIAKHFIEKYRKAKGFREQWVSLFEECYEYALPQRESFYYEEHGQRRDEKIFDETAVVGTQEFASRLQSGIVPNFARWADFVSGSEVDPQEREEVDNQLDEVTNYVFEVLQNSNFSQEVHESFMDLAVGTGILCVEEGDSLNPINFSAIPLPHVVLDTGPDDRIDHVFRERKKVKFDHLPLMFPNSTFDSKVTSQMGSNRETTGRGPLINALSSIKTTNLTIQLILENAQMSISGIYQMEDDGVINPDTINLVPGTIIPKAMGSAGLQPIQAAGRFDVAQLVLGDLRLNIKRALYNDMLGNPDKTPATATEIAERMADLSRRMGASFGRLQAELVQPLLQRVVYILKKQGRIEIPTVNGREIKVRSVSPLAQAQSNQDISVVSRFLEMIGNGFGPEMLQLLIDGEQTAIYLAKKFGVPESLIRDEEQRKQIAEAAQQLAEQQAMQQGMMPVEQQG
jgi:hypothetical protein